MSHEPVGPKSNQQEPGGSTSDCITLITKKKCINSNSQESVGSTSDRLMIILNTIHHICTQKKVKEPFINNMYVT